MAKMMVFALALGFLAARSNAQQAGIDFKDELSWQQVQAEAKTENKYIFVDCYTTWCGPCKYMAEKIFPLPEVGAFMNEHFVSVSVQMDKTNKDAPEVKDWYGVADTLAGNYGVEAYPTFLIFDPYGHIVHRFSGSVQEAKLFNEQVAQALDSNTQYYTVIGQYKQHLQDSAFLQKALKLAFSLGDGHSASRIADAYVSCLRNPFTVETLDLASRALSHPEGQVYRMFADNAALVDSTYHADKAYQVLLPIVYLAEVDTPAYSGRRINWDSLSDRVHQLNPMVAEQAILMGEIAYFKNNKDVGGFERVMSRYMDLFTSHVNNYDKNDCAWTVFQLSSNRKLLEKALVWSKLSIAAYPAVDWEYLDTYSNLLYKTGHKEEAIEWEKKAVELAQIADQKKEFEATLQKMERGEKTWN